MPAAWHAWQWVQEGLAVVFTVLSDVLLLCITQSDMLFVEVKSTLASVFVALVAIIFIAAISVAMASPIQPRKGSKAIMRMNIKRRTSL